MFEQLRIAVLGATGAGKSGLVLRFVQGVFLNSYDPTIEDIYRKQLQADNKEYRIDIVDTAGAKEFRGLLNGAISSADGMIIVYCVCDRNSWNEALSLCSFVMEQRPDWQGLRAAGGNLPTAFCAAQLDLLSERQRAVSEEELKEKAEVLHCMAHETSAATGEGVDELFRDVARAAVAAKLARTGQPEAVCVVPGA
eukprot:TRINITY_DN20124_c0_g1_i1.p1 TRINITY_DN20124_c0_g1~~TRINITY_DN20124_c0_g1_i1.p1  ORF type:complete len:226 (+),score=65.48 TRINITY_DN20124_c0_g1_i1:91-678(+)